MGYDLLSVVKTDLHLSAESDYEFRFTGSNVLDILRLLSASAQCLPVETLSRSECIPSQFQYLFQIWAIDLSQGNWKNRLRSPFSTIEHKGDTDYRYGHQTDH